MRWTAWVLLATSTSVWAQSKGSSGGLPPYAMEFTPIVGITLPYDVRGIAGTLNAYGLQAAYSINDSGALTASGFYQLKDNDTAITADAGYRHEINSALFHAFFDVGLHYSRFSLKEDRDANGACDPANCETDTGSHVGLYIGSGVAIPMGTSTLARIGFRFYNNPQAWVMLSAGLGLRY